MATANPTAGKGGAQDQLYEWEGKDRNGKVVRGEMRAGGEAMVSATLRRQGVMVSKIKKRRTAGGKSITQKDLAVFTRQLATMMRAHLPLLHSCPGGVRRGTTTRGAVGNLRRPDGIRLNRPMRRTT